ncbi:MAG: hypothetical protein L3J00_00360 [Thiomicrorhabdus sp.]|nr:hypothetical protein [Thiomicrorhabdus sp.]
MEPQLIVSLSGLLGMTVTLMVIGITWLKRKPLNSDFNQDCKVFYIRPEIRFLGLFLAIISITVMTLVVFLIPVEEFKPSDWVMAFIFGIFIGGFGSISGVMLFIIRAKVNKHGVLGYSALGIPRFMAWSDLNLIEFSGGMQSYKLIGCSGHIYVSTLIEKKTEFIALLKQNILPEKFEIDLKSHLNSNDCPEKFMSKKHFESMVKHAPTASILLTFFITFSFLFLPPYAYALFISALAGIMLIGSATARYIWPNLPSYWLIILDFLSIMSMSILSNLAWSKYTLYLESQNSIDNYTQVFIMLQTLGTTMLFVFLTLITVKKMYLTKKIAKHK